MTRCSGGIPGPDRVTGPRVRYDAVFLDVDGTLLSVELDLEGYVEDLAPYVVNGSLTVERAQRPVWEGLRRHIEGNIEHRTEEDLAAFKRRNAQITAGQLGIRAPANVLAGVAERRISFIPYPESEAVLQRLAEMDVRMYVVSNWDLELVEVLEGLGWMHYFDGFVVSAVSGVEKPDRRLFEEALEVSGVKGERAIHVGNDPVADVKGAADAGIDTVLVNRGGIVEVPEATFVVGDLGELPDLLEG